MALNLSGETVVYEIARTDTEIDDVRNLASDAFDTGTKFSGMNYEEGIMAAFTWVFGETDEAPMGE